MASGNSEDYEYVAVTGSQLQANTSVDTAGGYNSEMSELQAVKQLNKSLSKQIQTLKEEIKGFKDERNALAETNKRDMDKQKLETKTILAKKSEIQKREAILIEEIKKLKAELKFLEKTESELRCKIKKLEATKYPPQEYEKEKREMSASKEEINKLKEQIAVLEAALEKKDELLTKTKEENRVMATGFDHTMREMTKSHEANMNSMKTDILQEMKKNDESTKDMFYKLQELILADKEKQPSVEPSPKVKLKSKLPPIGNSNSRWKNGFNK